MAHVLVWQLGKDSEGATPKTPKPDDDSAYNDTHLGPMPKHIQAAIAQLAQGNLANVELVATSTSNSL